MWLIGVVLLRVFTMWWPVLMIRLVAGGCLSRLVVVKDQLTGLVVRLLGERQPRMKNIPQILMMNEVTSGRKDLRKHGLGERRQTDRKVRVG